MFLLIVYKAQSSSLERGTAFPSSADHKHHEVRSHMSRLPLYPLSYLAQDVAVSTCSENMLYE